MDAAAARSPEVEQEGRWWEEKTLFFLELGKDLVAHASTVFLECALLWAVYIHGPHSLGKFCPVSDHFGLCATGLDTVKPICPIVPHIENFFYIFSKIYGPQKNLQNYTSSVVGDGDRDGKCT
jgi:hypothetical protein